jgi:hypothetical protein
MPVIEPPVMDTLAADCVAIVPKPRFVRAVDAEERSERLLDLKAYVVSWPVSVTPKLVLAVAASVAPVPPRATVRVPVVPAIIGRPVAFVRVTAEGVPRSGVVSVGDVARTTLPVPVTDEKERFPDPSVPSRVLAAPSAEGSTKVVLVEIEAAARNST